MKAVILAGGRGERLRPITDTRPKPLVPVLARPVMDYCLSLLSHHGVTKAFVTTHYLADQIRHRYGESAFGLHLEYLNEEIPLGTAGGLKRIEKELENEDAFLVMSGDALCDFDLSRAISFHRSRQADATIILSSVKTPLEYGVVLSDTFERIFAFSEKPDWCETFSDLVNTGVYILSPGVLKKIPEGTPFDFSHDLFPLLLKEGYSLFGYKDQGYWCDIGKIPSLYRCNQDALEGKLKTYVPPHGRKVACEDGDGYYFISDQAEADQGAVIRQGTVLSSGVRLAKGSRTEGSLILENACLEKGALAKNAVICENSVLRENSVAMPGSVLGASSVVLEDAVVPPRKKVLPHSSVFCQSAFFEDSLVFTENGAGMGETVGLDSLQTEELGKKMALALEQNVSDVWDEEKEESSGFALQFASGVLRGGKSVFLCGGGTEKIAMFAPSRLRVPSVFLSAREGKALIFCFERDGFPLIRKDVLRMSREIREPSHLSHGELLFPQSIQEDYLRELSQAMGNGSSLRIGIGGSAARYLREAAILSGVSAYDSTREVGFSIEVFPDGLKLFFNSEKIADREKAELYVIQKEMERGRKDFVLPEHTPLLFREFIQKRKGSVSVFSTDQTWKNQLKERTEAQKDRWLYDENFLAAYLIGELAQKSAEEIHKEFSRLPDLYITRLFYVPDEGKKARVLRDYHHLEEKDKNVRIRPGFHGIRIISEALRFEAALDHAFECRGKLNEIEKNIRGD